MSSDDIDLRQFPMADWRSGHGASEDHKSATSDGSRKNHDNPGINAPRPPKSSARLVAVGLTSRRDMPEVLFVGVAGNGHFWLIWHSLLLGNDPQMHRKMRETNFDGVCLASSFALPGR